MAGYSAIFRINQESLVHSMDVTGMQIIGALLTALVVCAALGPVLIPVLHKLKFGQSIRDAGPASHMKKSGTPTMGGIMMLCGLFVAMMLWNRFTPLIIIAFVLTFGHALIGFLDDYIKVVMKRNLGLTAKQKLALQIALAMAYIYYVEQHAGASGTDLWIPGTVVTVHMGWLYYVLVLLLLVGTTNAVNLTDGLDGLVSSVSIGRAGFQRQHTSSDCIFVYSMAGRRRGFVPVCGSRFGKLSGFSCLEPSPGQSVYGRYRITGFRRRGSGPGVADPYGDSAGDHRWNVCVGSIVGYYPGRVL